MAARKKVAVLYRGLGRRKSSTARVIVKPGNGTILVNGRDVNEYFPSEICVMDLSQPLELTNTKEMFDVTATVRGGGYTGQTGAIRHGISRALCQADADFRPVLKKAGFLTRDPRMKERKKYGLKSARRAPQFSKR